MSSAGEGAGPDSAAADRPSGVAGGARYLPELEGLRGVAMLLVLAFHTDALLHMQNRPPAGEVVPLPYALVRNGGDLGVDLFFVLSSFLLTLAFLREPAPGSASSLRAYARRRALRILPLYYFAVLVAVLVHTRTPADLARGLPYLAFLNVGDGWTTPLLPFSGVWWSLATEAQFYVTLALAAWLFRSPGGRRVGGLALGAWLVAYVAWLSGAVRAGGIGAQWALSFSLFGRAPSFLGGAAVAWLFARHGAALRARFAGRWAALGAGVALGVVVLLIAVLMRWVIRFGSIASQFPAWQGYHVLQSLLCGALLALVVFAAAPARTALSHPALLRLGVLSYSMYLWHLPILFAGLMLARAAGVALGAGWTWRGTALVAACWGLCFGVSTLTYRFVERPFLVRKARLGAA